MALGWVSEHLKWIKVIAGCQTQSTHLFTHCMSLHNLFVICCVYLSIVDDQQIAIYAVLSSLFTECVIIQYVLGKIQTGCF